MNFRCVDQFGHADVLGQALHNVLTAADLHGHAEIPVTGLIAKRELCRYWTEGPSSPTTPSLQPTTTASIMLQVDTFIHTYTRSQATTMHASSQATMRNQPIQILAIFALNEGGGKGAGKLHLAGFCPAAG